MKIPARSKERRKIRNRIMIIQKSWSPEATKTAVKKARTAAKAARAANTSVNKQKSFYQLKTAREKFAPFFFARFSPKKLPLQNIKIRFQIRRNCLEQPNFKNVSAKLLNCLIKILQRIHQTSVLTLELFLYNEIVHNVECTDTFDFQPFDKRFWNLS